MTKEEVKFNTVQELYSRLKPALNTRLDEIHRSGLSYVMIEDIWNYLKKNTWNTSKDLNLYEMVDDIMNVDFSQIDLHVKETFGHAKRTINEEDPNLL